MISAEQFSEWKEHPVTKELFADLVRIKENIIDQMVNGATIGASAESTHGFTCKAVGHLDGINQLLGITYDGGNGQEDTVGKSRY